MKITVFGGSGFLGSHVTDVLTQRGHKVRIFDRKKSAYLVKGQEMMIGDVADEKLKRALSSMDDIAGKDVALTQADADIAARRARLAAPKAVQQLPSST